MNSTSRSSFAKGKRLRTLRDAAEHTIALPKRETKQDNWHTAMACLIDAAEKREIVMMARIAMAQGLVAGKPQAAPRKNRQRNTDF